MHPSSLRSTDRVKVTVVKGKIKVTNTFEDELSFFHYTSMKVFLCVDFGIFLFSFFVRPTTYFMFLLITSIRYWTWIIQYGDISNVIISYPNQMDFHTRF